MEMKVADLDSAKMSREWLRAWLIAALLAMVCCASAATAQTVQALPELDTYLELNSTTRIWFQAKETREGGVPSQAEIGPSLDFYIRSLPKLEQIATLDRDHSKKSLLVLSLGYRYLPQANDAPATNRLEPVATLQLPLKGALEFSDRNRADLDWEQG